MTATATEARDDFYGVIRTAWIAAGELETLLSYEDRPSKDKFPPAKSCPWARLMFRHVFGRQATLSNSVGSRRFRRSGLATSQLFCPTGSSLREPERLSKVLTDAVEGVCTQKGIAFINVRVNEVGSDSHWYQVNILADFEYDEIK